MGCLRRGLCRGGPQCGPVEHPLLPGWLLQQLGSLSSGSRTPRRHLERSASLRRRRCRRSTAAAVRLERERLWRERSNEIAAALRPRRVGTRRRSRAAAAAAAVRQPPPQPQPPQGHAQPGHRPAPAPAPAAAAPPGPRASLAAIQLDRPRCTPRWDRSPSARRGARPAPQKPNPNIKPNPNPNPNPIEPHMRCHRRILRPGGGVYWDPLLPCQMPWGRGGGHGARRTTRAQCTSPPRIAASYRGAR